MTMGLALGLLHKRKDDAKGVHREKWKLPDLLDVSLNLDSAHGLSRTGTLGRVGDQNDRLDESPFDEFPRSFDECRACP